MLGAMTSHETVGLYRVTSQGATLVAFALQASKHRNRAHVARLYAEDATGRECIVESFSTEIQQEKMADLLNDRIVLQSDRNAGVMRYQIR